MHPSIIEGFVLTFLIQLREWVDAQYHTEQLADADGDLATTETTIGAQNNSGERAPFTNSSANNGLLALFLAACAADPHEAIGPQQGSMDPLHNGNVKTGGAEENEDDASLSSLTAKRVEKGKTMARFCAVLAASHQTMLCGGSSGGGSSGTAVAALHHRTTIRDVYYMHTHLFEAQCKVERAVEAMCHCLSAFAAAAGGLGGEDAVAGASFDESNGCEEDHVVESKSSFPSLPSSLSHYLSHSLRPACRALVPFLPLTRECVGFGATARSILIGSVGFSVVMNNLSTIHGSTATRPGEHSASFINVAAASTKGIVISSDFGCAAQGFVFGRDAAALASAESERLRPKTSARRRGAAASASCSRSKQHHAIDIFVVEKECTLMTIVQREGGAEGRHYCMAGSSDGKDDDDSNHRWKARGAHKKEKHEEEAKRSAVFMCGKGYPCVAARSLLRRMVEEAVAQCIDTEEYSPPHPHHLPSEINLFFVVDGDGDGMLIMLSYLSALVGVAGAAGAVGCGDRLKKAKDEQPKDSGAHTTTTTKKGARKPPTAEEEEKAAPSKKKPSSKPSPKESNAIPSSSSASNVSPSSLPFLFRPPPNPLHVEWVGLRPSSIAPLRTMLQQAETASRARTSSSSSSSLLPITFASDRCVAKVKTIQRTAQSIVDACDAIMLQFLRGQNARDGGGGGELGGAGECNTAAESEEEGHAPRLTLCGRGASHATPPTHSPHSPQALASYFIAEAVKAMIIERIPPEVDHFARTRVKAELQLAHIVANAFYTTTTTTTTTTNSQKDDGSGVRGNDAVPMQNGLEMTRGRFNLSTTLGVLLATADSLPPQTNKATQRGEGGGGGAPFLRGEPLG